MEKLEFDLGLVEYMVPGGGVLRFHPADPGLYGRFADAQQKLEQMEQELTRKGRNASPEALLQLMQEADAGAKALLGQVFGPGNDFHQALGGISLLAVCADGRTVAQSLMAALAKVLEQGTERLVEQKLAAAQKAL